MTGFTVKEIFQRELGIKKFPQRWFLHSLSDAQMVARVEATKEMLRILQESETNDFDGIATGDLSWFQHTMVSSNMPARSAADVISRTRQAVGATKLWSRCCSQQRNSLCSMFLQGAARSLNFIPKRLSLRFKPWAMLRRNSKS
jgi:hypothetical protein